MTPRIFLPTLLCLATLAHAHEHFYEATLSGLNESVPNASPGTGTAAVMLDLDLITMDVHLDFAGLLGTTTGASIHGLTALPGTGDAGAMSPTFAATGFPLGVTAGSYDSLFDLTDAPGYDPAFIVTSGGTVSDALNALIASFDEGRAYVSIESSAFPGGEIRSFFTEVFPVPEPASAAMLILGSGALAAIRRRSRIA